MEWQVKIGDQTHKVHIPSNACPSQWTEVSIADETWMVRWNDKLQTLFLRNQKQPNCEWPVAIHQQEVSNDPEAVGRHVTVQGIFRGDELRLDGQIMLAAPGVGQRMAQQAAQGCKIRSPMVGKVLAVQAKAGDKVKKGDELLIVEAMKMENKIFAPQAGVIDQVLVTQNQQVKLGDDLVVIKGGSD